MKTVIAGMVMVLAQAASPGPPPAAQGDEYVRYELAGPDTSSYQVTYDVSVLTAGATQYRDAIRIGSTVSQATAVDLMTGQPLAITQSLSALTVTLARPVPKNGQGRIRIQKTIKSATGYAAAGGGVGSSPTATFTEPLTSRRGSVVLPPGFELVSCNLPALVLSQPDGRVAASFMNQAPGAATLVITLRGDAQTGSAAAPKPLTNARSWEPPPAQGPTERARLSERAVQDRDITYFLQDPSTNSFSLFHDYTESRPGIDKYVNVVRTGSRVSNPSAYILDTGEVLKDEILRGPAITAAKIETGGQVTPDLEVVVVHFTPVPAGQSVRLRISETYAAPESYRLEGDDLVFDRSLGRPRNSVVLPAGWYLTALSIPAVVSETPDKKIRLDFYNGRNDSIDVLLKGRRRAR